MERSVKNLLGEVDKAYPPNLWNEIFLETSLKTGLFYDLKQRNGRLPANSSNLHCQTLKQMLTVWHVGGSVMIGLVVLSQHKTTVLLISTNTCNARSF